METKKFWATIALLSIILAVFWQSNNIEKEKDERAFSSKKINAEMVLTNE